MLFQYLKYLMSREDVSCELWIMSYECGVKLWSWNILLYEEILHCAVLRSEWQGYVFCSRLGICFSGRIIFETQRFLLLNYFFKWAKLAKFIRSEAMWWRMKDEGWRMKDEGWGVRGAGCEYAITKFTEMLWNDVVFEAYFSLCYASFRMTWLCFLLTIRNLFQ